jgi:heme/copper-type cytochrome/quinol oxidase subunit 4
MTYVLLAFIQITFNLLKILEIKYSYDENMKMTLLVGFFLAIVWLFSTAIGVSAVIKLDYVMMIDYVISSMFGKYLALKLRKNWKIKNNGK